jgi:hypothetical protein
LSTPTAAACNGDDCTSRFSEPELVELGYSIAITLGQQHWLATHGVVERL